MSPISPSSELSNPGMVLGTPKLATAISSKGGLNRHAPSNSAPI